MSGEPLTDSEFTLGGVSFKINKMLPIEAKRVFMGHVRPLLRGALSADADVEFSQEIDQQIEDSGQSSRQWKLALAAFTDAPQEHYDAIVRAMYGHIVYTKPGGSPTPLFGDEENCFNATEGFEAAHIVMLDIRAFCVNFTGSLGVVLSEFTRPKQGSQ